MRLTPTEVTPQLDDYMLGLLAPRDAVLARMESEIEREEVPGIGPHVGQLLALLLTTSGCREVLELDRYRLALLPG